MGRSLPEANRNRILTLWETVLLNPRYAGFMETALALSDAYERGQVQDLSEFADYCRVVAVELAGGPLPEWQTVSLAQKLPLPLKMATEAFINGLEARQPAAAPKP